ncbi:MAG: wax ester/triacylglycerol synthase family O-acyltransferase [Pseudomonadota bacterium]
MASRQQPRKLKTTDAAFIMMETEQAPMHVASVELMELPRGVTPDNFIEGLQTFISERLDLIPYLTNRLQFSPLNFDQPVWVRDEDFDIARHIYRVDAPAPGGQAELEATVARLHEAPMDRAHPLWEYAVICGLENNRVAYYSRIHHCAIDGVSGNAATQLLMDESPDHSARELPAPAPESHLGDHTPAELWLAGIENLTRSAVDLATNSMGLFETGIKLLQRTLNPGAGLGAALERAPRTRFNAPVTGERAYAIGELPLKDAKALAKGAKVTVNDVFLAVCGGALRRYLRRTGELPSRPLLAGCPVSLQPDPSAMDSNFLTMMKVSMGTHIEDPIRRLKHVSASANAAKSVTADSALALDNRVSFAGLPALMNGAARLNESLGLTRWVEAPVNLIVSNVPGPRAPLYSNGAKMLAHYPVSIPAHGNAVNITVQSYVDGMYFAVTGCARALPDAAVLRDDLLAAFEQLCAAMRSSVVSLPAVEIPKTEQPTPKQSDGRSSQGSAQVA